MTTQHTTGITAGTCDCKVVTIQGKYGKGIRIESATWEPCALHANANALLEAAREAYDHLIHLQQHNFQHLNEDDLARSHEVAVHLMNAIAAAEGRKE